jgi:hypothetical protein
VEYFLGSLVTILTLIVASRLLYRKIEDTKLKTISYSQSYIYDMISPLLPSESLLRPFLPIATQSKKHQSKINIRVVFLEGKAYWIKDNQFYVAKAENGVVLDDTTSQVDIMGMDKVELDKMIFIVDRLTEGTDNDRRNSGDQKF